MSLDFSPYVTVSRQELLDDLREQLTDWRYNHVLRVEQTALELAQEYFPSLDLAAVSLAALMHDYAKDLPADIQLASSQRNWPEQQDTLPQASSAIWHGFAAAQIAHERYGCTNWSILSAIRSHTIGWYTMDSLSQVIYLADYIEPKRDFDGVETARRLIKEDWPQAVRYKMQQTLLYTLKQGKELYLPSVAIYNHWFRKEEL